MSTQGVLKRQIGWAGAILLGLGSILGTGVFVSLGLAVGIAGYWAIGALFLATLLATMNALSSAQLAANHPVSGGTYAYGYRYLRPELGFMAGLAFLLAKSASAAAAAIGLVGYLLTLANWQNVPTNILAAGAVALMTGLVCAGMRRAGYVNALLVSLTLAALLALICASLFSQSAVTPSLPEAGELAPGSLFEAAALVFVAFTGYGRIATLGEEVTAPRRNIPRAMIATLIVTSVLYLGVLLSGLGILGAAGFAIEAQTSHAPLQAIAAALDMPILRGFIILAAVSAMAGVLLNLLLGLSRVAFAMGREGDLPAIFGKLDKRHEPFLATLAVGGFIAMIALFGGLERVWSFSAFTVLIYYALTNLAALRLTRQERLYPRAIPVLGLMGCLGLSVWVNWQAILIGSGLLASGLILRALLRR